MENQGMWRASVSFFGFRLTEHAHEDLVDPGEDADDVEGGEGNVEEEPNPHLDALVLAALPEMKYW